MGVGSHLDVAGKSECPRISFEGCTHILHGHDLPCEVAHRKYRCPILGVVDVVVPDCCQKCNIRFPTKSSLPIKALHFKLGAEVFFSPSLSKRQTMQNY